jgi:hypothetical protein
MAKIEREESNASGKRILEVLGDAREKEDSRRK